jgi:crossover junction endodeoxyribonuclease RuvC
LKGRTFRCAVKLFIFVIPSGLQPARNLRFLSVGLLRTLLIQLVYHPAPEADLPAESAASPATLASGWKLMRILGIDCGGEYTGYGVVEQDDEGSLHHLCSGAIRLLPREPLELRLKKICEKLTEIIAAYAPEQVAIEDVFYAVNVKSALKLGHVRGVAMLAAAQAGLRVVAYSPLSIKSAVVGYGKAEKCQVQVMVARLLALPAPPDPPDVADALAIAICHLHTAGTLRRQQATTG